MSDDALYDDLPDNADTDSNVADAKEQEPMKRPRASGLDNHQQIMSSTVSRSKIERPKSLVDEVDDLQQRLKAIEEENAILKRNMGTLYRTALSEIERKEAEIERLQRALDETMAAKR